ncbi:site-specific integrase [Natronosalvus halobius]|uniref:site-specific integrase n=1 Tax=Natronosalvus halobius TaxID=2953746 RepID=UPI00209E864E|nr:site-specific integrase [Natronosalvus halobius]USZ71258.1 site-specific integrase [Natronosalvus halobius]
MRVERNADGTYNVWMSRNEYQRLVRCTESTEEEIALRLMGDCGLRSKEVLNARYSDVKRSGNGNSYFLRVRHGKDSTGEKLGGKYRETWLPDDLEMRLYKFKEENDLEHDEPLVQVSRRTLNNWVSYAGNDAANQYNDEDYHKVSTHDLRRQWAQHLLVEQRVNPRVVMSLGGWGSYSAIEPYLNAPSEKHIVEEMHGIL